MSVDLLGCMTSKILVSVWINFPMSTSSLFHLSVVIQGMQVASSTQKALVDFQVLPQRTATGTG